MVTPIKKSFEKTKFAIFQENVEPVSFRCDACDDVLHNACTLRTHINDNHLSKLEDDDGKNAREVESGSDEMERSNREIFSRNGLHPDCGEV